jgi:hypothetical protein
MLYCCIAESLQTLSRPHYLLRTLRLEMKKGKYMEI